ncbi:TPA: hypothetical protein ACU2HP_002547 [Staphylococcus aureus]|nr:hypothetical protein [Staphylococcus aureus]HDA2612593.1 hypothetical protein [Staphylococcus aureus]HDE6767587.1 hypothetical protein [Staphylococcus aureus]HDJ3342415.1 hypothetical protein [Staphylococcus aureus]
MFLIFSVLQQNGIKNGIICSCFSFIY